MMRIGILLVVVFLIFEGTSLFAQEKGTVTVIKDPQIDSLIKRRLELSQPNTGSIASTGFRVQIFSGLDRQEAYQQQTKFKAGYPNVRTYISYVQPNYRLRVGDFRTKIEAEKFMYELRRKYSSLFIFSEKINLR